MKTSLVRILVFPVFICRLALMRKACPRQRDLPRYSYPLWIEKFEGEASITDSCLPGLKGHAGGPIRHCC